MMRFFASFFYVFSFWTIPALADIDLKLSLKIDLENSRLSVVGSSPHEVRFPEHAENLSTGEVFSYQVSLPKPAKSARGHSQAFVGSRSFYLPWGWHPEIDSLMTFDLSVESPWVVVAPGKLMEEHRTDHIYKARFIMDRPTDSIPLFGGTYHIREKSQKGLLLRTYFFETNEALSDGYLDRTARYIDQFTQEIGPYPFDGFHIIAAELPVGLGFAGMTYIGERVLNLPFIKDSSLGHEILHNYWGNAVFPIYRQGNWAEGLTSYQADYRTQEIKSEELAKDMRLSWLRDYAALPAEKDRPVTHFISKHDGASEVIGYHKAAYIFHMVRQKIGDDAFFQGLKFFWSQKAFQNAGWGALENAFSTAAQQDLSGFFEQWLTTTGAPYFQKISAQTEFVEQKGWRLDVQISQSSEQIFKLDVPLQITTHSALLEKTLRLETEHTAQSFWLTEKPLSVSLDPDFHLFRKLGPLEAPPILRDAMLAEQVNLTVLSTDLQETAETLVRRMVDGAIVDAGHGAQAHIIVGYHADLKKRMQTAPKMSSYDFEPLENVSAQVWIARDDDQYELYISVQNQDALSALLRPLPHYGRRGALQFIGSKAVYRASGTAQPLKVDIP